MNSSHKLRGIFIYRRFFVYYEELLEFALSFVQSLRWTSPCVMLL